MADPDDDAPPGMPRWVKVFGLVAIAILAAFALLHLTGIAPHGH
jgi:hypothetical protein